METVETMRVYEKFGGAVDFMMSPEARSAVMAIIITWLRIAYDGKEKRWQRQGLEALLCGALAYGMSSGLSYFEVLPGVAVFCGAVVGFLGADFLRIQMRRFVREKMDASGKDTDV